AAREQTGPHAIEMMAISKVFIFHPRARIDDGHAQLAAESRQVIVDTGVDGRGVPAAEDCAFGHEVEESGNALLSAQSEQIAQGAVRHRRDLEMLKILIIR